MLAPAKSVSVEAFEAFINLPENADRIFQLIGGEIVEAPSNIASSHISSRINRRMGNFVEDRELGYITGEAGGYTVSGERYAPDVAFIAKPKTLTTEWFAPFPPDLAVEVDYPSSLESRRILSIKIPNYLLAGVVVWVVYPQERLVHVYEPTQPVKILGENDTLDGGRVLPGFTLLVKDIFDWK